MTQKSFVCQTEQKVSEFRGGGGAASSRCLNYLDGNSF